jgi:8-oxo-dGTP diphosphatase
MNDESFIWTPPKMSVAADVVVLGRFASGLHVLLVERRNEPFRGAWAIPGGFVELDEDLEDAARRELLEETGVVAGHLHEVGAFGKPGRDPRGRTVSIVYSCFVDGERVMPIAGDDAAKASWFAVGALPPLAFDHAEILRRVLAR